MTETRGSIDLRTAELAPVPIEGYGNCMATTPSSQRRPPTSSSPSPEGKSPPEGQGTRAVRVAKDAKVEAAIRRVSREHRELIEDLAK